MTQNVDQEHCLDGINDCPSEEEKYFGSQLLCYAQALRALGQTLEADGFVNFELQFEGGIYVVRGTTRSSKPIPAGFAAFIRDIFGARAGALSRVDGKEMGKRYTFQEIARLDDIGRERRGAPTRMPDPYSPSQILRGAGSYLDNRDQTSLVEIVLEDRWVTVRYKTDAGALEQLKQDIQYFYDYWVKMYLRRANRSELPSPRDPGFIVGREGGTKK